VSDDLLVYGAYGYTGELVAERAAADGLDPVLGGRDADRLRAVGDRLGARTRAFDLADAAANLEGVGVLLNCAGPFDATADPAVDACLATGTDYLDVTGEIPVFERHHRRDDDARAAGVVLLPGVGFDVVPTDCTAARLVARLPEAESLALAFAFAADGGVSPGTLRTAVAGLGGGGAVRRNGVLRAAPVAGDVRRVDFGDGRGPRAVASVPWGDVSTAYHTTGVGNVTAYAPMSAGVRRAVRLLDRAGPLLDRAPVRGLLDAAVDRFVEGPDAETRRAGRAHVWGEATGPDGRVVARLRTPEPYALTVRTAVESARRVLAGDVAPGARTPAGAFGPEYVLGFDGVEEVEGVEGVEGVEEVEGLEDG
jgi:short subunit dehydrogenase-like uncharacterized protein